MAKTVTIPAPKPYDLDWCDTTFGGGNDNNNNNDDDDDSHIIAESTKCPFILRKSSKATAMNHLYAIQSPKDIYNTVSGIQAFGRLNELEYSSNFKVYNQEIKQTNDQSYRMIRHYHKAAIDVFVNGCKISTGYIKDSCRIATTAVLRIDYDADTGAVLNVSSKLKLFNDKFNFLGSTVSLTGAIEVDVPELAETLAKSQHFTQRRDITYWYLQMVHRNRQYHMRIAFRRTSPIKPYECNVECEEQISGSQFLECFDLIYKYYKTMCQKLKYIQPLHDDVEPLDLTFHQQQTMATFTQISKDEYQGDAAAAESIIEQPLQEFVKCLGLISYNRGLTEEQHIDTEKVLDLKYASIKDVTPTFDRYSIDAIFNTDDIFANE